MRGKSRFDYSRGFNLPRGFTYCSVCGRRVPSLFRRYHENVLCLCMRYLRGDPGVVERFKHHQPQKVANVKGVWYVVDNNSRLLVQRCSRTDILCTHDNYCVVDQKSMETSKCRYALKDKQTKLF